MTFIPIGNGSVSAIPQSAGAKVSGGSQADRATDAGRRLLSAERFFERAGVTVGWKKFSADANHNVDCGISRLNGLERCVSQNLINLPNQIKFEDGDITQVTRFVVGLEGTVSCSLSICDGNDGSYLISPEILSRLGRPRYVGDLRIAGKTAGLVYIGQIRTGGTLRLAGFLNEEVPDGVARRLDDFLKSISQGNH